MSNSQYNNEEANEAGVFDVLMYFDLSAYNPNNDSVEENKEADEDKEEDKEKPYTVKMAIDVIKENKEELIMEDPHNEQLINVLEGYQETHPDFGNLVISNISTNDPQYSGPQGLNAAVFTDPTTKNVTVAYRGTGNGEWPDNGEGLGDIDVGSHEESEQQAEALRYFDNVVEKNGYADGGYHITITGHSKGGNKAQYVTMMSSYSNLIDVCYNYDGQGFSPEAIQEFKERLGDKYEAYVNKLYTIAADNDYVNILGVILVPEGHRYYYQAGCGANLMENHYPYAIFNGNGLFKGEPSSEPGCFGQILQEMMLEIMALPPKERNILAEGMMTIAHSILTEKETKDGVPLYPVNGDQLHPVYSIVSALYLISYFVGLPGQTVHNLVLKQTDVALEFLEKEALSLVSKATEGIASITTAGVDLAAGVTKQALVELKTLLEQACDSMQDFLDQVGKNAKELVRNVMEDLKDKLQELKDDAIHAVDGAIRVVEGITIQTLETGKEAAFAALDRVDRAVIGGIQDVRIYAEGITENISAQLQELSDISAAIAKEQSQLHTLSGLVTATAAKILSEISGTAADGIPAITQEALTEMEDFFHQAIQGLKQGLAAFCNSIQEGVRQWAENRMEELDQFAGFLDAKIKGFMDAIKVTATEAIDDVTVTMKNEVNKIEYQVNAELDVRLKIVDFEQNLVKKAIELVKTGADEIAKLLFESIEQTFKFYGNIILEGIFHNGAMETMRKFGVIDISWGVELVNLMKDLLIKSDSRFYETSYTYGYDVVIPTIEYKQATGQVGLEYDNVPKLVNLADRVISEYNPKVRNCLNNAENLLSQLRFSTLNLSDGIQTCRDSLNRQDRSLTDFVTQLKAYEQLVRETEEEIVNRLSAIKLDCRVD